MARWLVFCMVSLALFFSPVTSRPFPAVEATNVGAGLELSGAGEANAPSLSVRVDGPEFWMARPPESPVGRQEEHRRTADKSMAGAEVMLAGLAAAIFASIVAYVRVTRKRTSEIKA